MYIPVCMPVYKPVYMHVCVVCVCVSVCLCIAQGAHFRSLQAAIDVKRRARFGRRSAVLFAASIRSVE